MIIATDWDNLRSLSHSPFHRFVRLSQLIEAEFNRQTDIVASRCQKH